MISPMIYESHTNDDSIFGLHDTNIGNTVTNNMMPVYGRGAVMFRE